MRKRRRFLPYSLFLKGYSRENRNHQTPAEAKLWYEVLRKRQLRYKFLRQKPLKNYIADFYCSKLLLVIEVDGESHFGNWRYDMRRTQELGKLGVKVIRYTNAEVLESIKYVQGDLLKEIKLREMELKN
jgi:very-short-patch-repair endonuclease